MLPNKAELHIIITPTHVEKVQLLADDDEGELVGLMIYKELIKEVQRFTRVRIKKPVHHTDMLLLRCFMRPHNSFLYR